MTLYHSLKIKLLRPKVMRRRTQVYVISYPKSGRTWLKVLIGKAVCLKFGLPDSMLLETFELTEAAGLLPTHFTHDYSEILSGLPYYALPAVKSEYADKKVIFVVRDVKDVLVSSYFQATKRTYKYTGSLSDFIRNEKYGVKKVVTFYNIWYRNRHVPEEFLLLRYEEMHRQPEDILAQTLRLMGLAEVERSILKEAIAFAGFENMKKMEANGYFKDPKMRPGNLNDEESFKVRKGVVGGYRAYLSESDIEYIDQTMEELGCPFVQTHSISVG
ncbi:MAG TPA: sulfotransferase domain-containing protein [Anaerolineae bacterium]|nr:sulfotransferase domain-containing protein [Anaerolineae bacterium]